MSTKSNVSQKRSTKLNVFQKNVNEIEVEDFPKRATYILSWLIDLTRSYESFPWLDWVGSYVLSNIIELIGIFKLYRFMVTESVHFHILPRLSWLIWHESYTSLVTSTCRMSHVFLVILCVHIDSGIHLTPHHVIRPYFLWSWGQGHVKQNQICLSIFLHKKPTFSELPQDSKCIIGFTYDF